jgi:hypothetical protein
MNNNVSIIKDRFCQFDCHTKRKNILYNPTTWTSLSDEINEIVSNHTEYVSCNECDNEIDLVFNDLEIYNKVDILLQEKGLDSLNTFCNKLCPLEIFIRRLEEEKIYQP